MLLRDILENRRFESKTAIKCGNEEITYNQFYSRSLKLSHRIREIESTSENVAIFLPNSIEYAIAYFAVSFANMVIIPLDVKSQPYEINNIISFCDIQLVISNDKFANKVQSISKDVTIITVDSSINVHIDELSEPMNNAEDKINENDIAIILRTSGTTNSSKCVMLTHKNLISNIQSNIESLKLTQNDTVLIGLPMYFGYCNTSQFLTHLYLGGSIVIMDTMFSPKYFYEYVEKEKITNFTAVPSMLLMLLMLKHTKENDMTSLRYIIFGGGNMPLEKLRLLIERHGNVGFIQTYGQTEASPRITALLPEDSLRKLGSIGKPIPNVKLRIVNDEGNDVNTNEMGEIIVQSPGVMKGYYKRQDMTEDAIRDGWLYTGDLAFFDGEGYIYLIGRKKNIIISGGINIFPEEIEEVLMCHSAVKEAFVYSQPHELLGEIPVAKVVKQNACDGITQQELINYVYEKLTSYKVPAKIYFADQLIKTPTGKIMRGQGDSNG